MAITVSGTNVTFNDATTIASRLGMITGTTINNGYGTSMFFSGIPVDAKQIWIAFKTGYVSGPGGIVGTAGNGTNNMSFNGTVTRFTTSFSGGPQTVSTATSDMLSGNLFSYSGASQGSTPPDAWFCFTFQDEPGTGISRYLVHGSYSDQYYQYQLLGSGTIAAGTRMTNINIAYSQTLRDFYGTVYWEI